MTELWLTWICTGLIAVGLVWLIFWADDAE